MKYIATLITLLLFFHLAHSQNISDSKNQSHQGEFYFYWGWNQDWFSQSDIHFRGAEYDFELKNVVAKDRQSSFSLKTYFHPTHFTIPQYNFRVGYFFKNKYNLSIGTDHMKYVMQNNQTVKISGSINQSGTNYDGVYKEEDIFLTDEFLQFEHTDGLNYINLELRRLDHLFDWKFLTLNLTEGIGSGILFPRTNVVWFGEERSDQFHVSGFGVNALLGIQLKFRKYFFIQTELKGGYINMPDIRTTNSSEDKASQQFYFGQFNVVFGATLNPKRK